MRGQKDSCRINFLIILALMLVITVLMSHTVVKMKISVSHSVVSDSTTPRTVARQAPLSMGFSRQEY